MPTRKAPWQKKRPPGPHHKLSASEKAEAKRNAEKAGRRYPNLVDNMNVVKRRSSRKKG